MSLIVTKFGGSSVANVERVKHVAGIVAQLYDQKNKVVVVVSAQGDTTDELIEKATTPTPASGRWICCFPPGNSKALRCWP